MTNRCFLDSSIILYAVSGDPAKADRAEAILLSGGIISVQVLNEVTDVAIRKYSLAWEKIDGILGLIRAVCQVEPLTADTYVIGRRIAEKYRLRVHDAMIIAAALNAKCDIVYTEDMHDGLVVDDRLHILDPFALPH